MRGLLLGVENVLCSTACYHVQAWETVLDRYGIPIDRSLLTELHSADGEDALERIPETGDVELSLAERDTLIGDKNDLYRQLLANIDPSSVLPGVIELLHALRKSNYRLCVVSASRNVILLLRRLGIHEMFDAICDGNDRSVAAGQGKLYGRACALIDVPPEQAIVWENIAAHRLAALAEGLTVIQGSAREAAAKLICKA